MTRFVGLALVALATATLQSHAQDLRPCVISIKKEMAGAGIPFVNSTQTSIDDQAGQVNAVIKSSPLNTTRYSVTKSRKTGAISEVSYSKSRFHQVQNGLYESETVSADLDYEADSKAWPLTLSLEYSLMKDGLKTEFAQVFNVDRKCNRRLVEVSLLRAKRQSSTQIEVFLQEYSAAGGNAAPVTKQVAVPAGALWTDELPDINTLADLNALMPMLKGKRIFTFLSNDIVVAEIKFSGAITGSTKNPVTGKPESLTGQRMIIETNGQTLFVVDMLGSTTSDLVITQIPNSDPESVTVSKAFWDRSFPSTKVEFRELINKANPVLFERPGTVLLRVSSSETLRYGNLGRYWTQRVERPLNGKAPFTVQHDWESVVPSVPRNLPQFDPRSAAKANGDFLNSTKYVQTDLPAIVQIQKNLMAGFRGTRVDMAERILAEVNSLLTYDYDMLNNRTVTPLTTASVYKLRKGVCQHFANLFAALARGVGLPTRIITGFIIHNGEIATHAWNEAEIAPGYWLPIEPQSDTLDRYFFAYIPVAVSSALDAGEDAPGYVEEVRLLGLTSFMFEARGLPQKKK